MDLIKRYFPDLSHRQQEQMAQLVPLYTAWNAKINVVSRQDIDNLEERHILHSLGIAKVMNFKPGARLLDLGTGGGFPGVPLAIFFPDVQFVLVDGTGKKINVVQEVASSVGLHNLTAHHSRAEDLKMSGQFDFVLSRGVASLDQLMRWSQPLLKRKHQHAYPNGILALKGGDLHTEIRALPGRGDTYTEVFPLRAYFQEPFFDEKMVVYVQG